MARRVTVLSRDLIRASCSSQINASTRTPGLALIEAIEERCTELGRPTAPLAGGLGISPGYWHAICRQHKTIQPLLQKRSRCRFIAEFLNRPILEILSLAELVQPEDFVVHQTLDDQLNLLYQLMLQDPLVAALVPKPNTWDNAERSIKILATTLYQAALQKSILSKASGLSGNGGVEGT